MKAIKAKVLMDAISNIKPGKTISWTIYRGNDIEEVEALKNYVTAFFKTGTLMPIPVVKLGLDIRSVQTEYDDNDHSHLIIIEGVVQKLPEI
jgi:hypothetical protein